MQATRSPRRPTTQAQSGTGNDAGDRGLPAVSNLEMGYLYEELIRRFSELSNETAGEHFTPREVIRLMVELLFCDDDDLLRKRGIAKTLFDPASVHGTDHHEPERGACVGQHLRRSHPRRIMVVLLVMGGQDRTGRRRADSNVQDRVCADAERRLTT